MLENMLSHDELNPIGLGTNAVGNYSYNSIGDERSRGMIYEALHLGINLFDTAYFYGMGHSEEVIGEVLKRENIRKDVLIATKAAHVREGTKLVISNDPYFLENEVYKALKRLQTDYIDIFYIHFPDEKTPKDHAVGALMRLKERGLIRKIGVSNFSLDQIKEANKHGGVDVVQDAYNLLDRSKEEEMIPYLKEEGIAFISYYPLASGLLTGKYTKDTPIPVNRKNNPQFTTNYAENLEKIELLEKMAREKNCQVSQLVLAWYLMNDRIEAVIPGAKNKDQIIINQKARVVKLTPSEYDEIDQHFK